MKAYAFRLEPVARVRRVQALLARQRVGEAGRALGEALARELADHDRYEASITDIGELDADAFAASRESAGRLAGVLSTSLEARERLGAHLQSARSAAVVAERRVAVLERLDGRRRQQWLDEARHEYAVVLDDLATVRAATRAQEAHRVD